MSNQDPYIEFLQKLENHDPTSVKIAALIEYAKSILPKGACVSLVSEELESLADSCYFREIPDDLRSSQTSAGQHFNKYLVIEWEDFSPSAQVQLQLASSLVEQYIEASRRRFFSSLEGLLGLQTHTDHQRGVRGLIQLEMPHVVVVVECENYEKTGEIHGAETAHHDLLTIATLLLSKLNPGEPLSRLGLARLCCILPENSKKQAQVRMESLRTEVEEEFRESTGTTISVGIARYPEDAKKAQELEKAVDDALYVATRGGKNMVAVSDAEQENDFPDDDGEDDGLSPHFSPLKPPPKGGAELGALKPS